MVEYGLMGIAAALAISAVGSSLGIGAAGQAVIGAWKKAFMQNKPASFMLLAFTGFPLSQTFYGLILMNTIVASAHLLESGVILGIGIFGGLAIGASAYFQGVAGAGAVDAFAETGKGFTNYVLVLGVIESVALLAMVFLMTMINTMAG